MDKVELRQKYGQRWREHGIGMTEKRERWERGLLTNKCLWKGETNYGRANKRLSFTLLACLQLGVLRLELATLSMQSSLASS